MKFDLHIHSIESKYKEARGIVDKSTKENVTTLLSKLNEFEVGLFSITDHNRFNDELYIVIDDYIRRGTFPKVKQILAGVEFDVVFDDGCKKCHIITIFNARNNPLNYKKIKDSIESDKLLKKDDYYTRERFEKILKKIGLDVILIACQRTGFHQSKSGTASLSEASKNPFDLIEVGYINALEFQKPKVEGIIKDGLKKIEKNIGLIMGSDCHEWSEYPKHDKRSELKGFLHSRADILPSFKGLLMAISSPETRINQQINQNKNFISDFEIDGKKIELVNGINVIIGENGSGKSTLLHLLNNGTNAPAYIKNLIKKNKMKCDTNKSNKKMILSQGEIVQRFTNSNLFPLENFDSIDHIEFKEAYNKYAKEIKDYISFNIKRKEFFDRLKLESLQFKDLYNVNTHYINVTINNEFTNIQNPHIQVNNDLVKILSSLKNLQNNYFQNYPELSKDLSNIIIELDSINKIISKWSKIVECEIHTRNIIDSEVKAYNKNIKKISTSYDNDIRDYKTIHSNFIEFVTETINKYSTPREFPKSPLKIEGSSKKPKGGFSFNSVANYNNKELNDEFFKFMFNRNYSTESALKTIDSFEKFVDSLTGCTDLDKLDYSFEINLQKFINEKCKCDNYIVDISENNNLGNTMGEQSLAYFKYLVENEEDKTIFLIDQPEDHISNYNISCKMIDYLNLIRRKKQIVLVTHNPLLVVNLDAEQVLFVNKINDKITVNGGPLEYEDDEINILNIIADNMDGGKSVIEKRLKVYG